MAHFYTSTHALTVSELLAQPTHISNTELMFDGDLPDSYNYFYRASEDLNAVKVCIILGGDDRRVYSGGRRAGSSRLKLHLRVWKLGPTGFPFKEIAGRRLYLSLPHAAVNYRIQSFVSLDKPLSPGSYALSVSLEGGADEDMSNSAPKCRFEVLDVPEDLSEVFEPYAAGFGELTANPEDLVRSKPMPAFVEDKKYSGADVDNLFERMLDDFIESQTEAEDEDEEEDDDCLDEDEFGDEEEGSRRLDPSDLYAVFRLRLRGWDEDKYRIKPAATIVYYFANGKRQEMRAIEAESDDEATPPVVSFAAKEDVRNMVPGPVYVELRVFDEPIAGFVGAILPGDGIPERGCFCGEHLAVIDWYNPQKGMYRLNKWRIEASGTDSESFGGDGVSTIDELSQMVGLNDVKTKIDSYVKLVRFHKLRADRGISSKLPPLHALFLGAPGTGKTSVAKLMGRLMKEAGVLSKGHVVVRERSQIVGKFYGDETKAMHEALEEADGGVLFIDEAYNLYKEADPKDPGREAIETLLSALADSNHRDWMLILGGYEDRIMKMFEMNPGLASRFPQSNRYRFADYTAEELLEIGTRFCVENAFDLSDDARRKLGDTLHLDLRQKDASFGNARHVLNLLETEVFPAMAARVSALESPTDEQLRLILPEDVPQHAVRTLRPSRLGFAG